MPYYDFECKFCIKVIEVNDPTPPFCTCCGNLMIRIWSSTPVHFKGTGFYSTGG
jgi:predicted nucleic acid-binding Zn ribbon protein